MSLWAKAQQLQGDALMQIHGVYGEHFPIEVRHYLAPWIESKMWSEIDPDNPQHEQYASTLLNSLIEEIRSRANSLLTEDLFLSKIRLIDAADNIHQRYSQEPLNLLRVIKNCLNTELKLVQQAENTGVDFGSGMSLIACEIAQQLEILRQRTHETGEELRRMGEEQESFALQYHEVTKISAHLLHLQNQPPNPQNPQNVEMENKLRRQKEMGEQMLNHKVTGLIQHRIALQEQLKGTITIISQVHGRILDEELIKWKREQQLAGNGGKIHYNLDIIQEWCESMSEIIWMNRQQIKDAERLKNKLPLDNQGVADILPQLNTRITELLSNLVTSTFVIEKQPPQVMKTNTRFTATVRLLVGGKLNVHMSPPLVKVSIISEAQAISVMKRSEKVGKSDVSGEILNNSGVMEYHAATRQLAVSFRNMQLKKIKRAEKKGTESVMDEKFSLLFHSQFPMGNGELMFQVWTLSLPVVVIVHGNQEPHAWATVTWDNAFAEAARPPFAVPDKVLWPYVAEALNVKFYSVTGRPIPEESLKFLAEKAFRSSNVSDFSGMTLSWSQFCKEPLPGRNFTFWEWFYAVMKLTREHLKGPWVDGSIMGFVRKKQAEEMLLARPSGTFLLRFSDSELGGITIAWVGCSEDSKHSEVFMLLPFTSKDFSIRCLADRISDLQHLVYLYPDIKKEQAFSKYYTPFTGNQTTTNNGYVKPMLVTQIPGFGSYCLLPTTPQPMFQPQSPDTASVIGDNVNSYNIAGGEVDYSEILGDFSGMDENLDFQEFIRPFAK